MVLTLIVDQVEAEDNLYCTLYDVAPLTAPQFKVAPLVVMEVADNDAGTPQVAAVPVVNDEAVEYADEPLLQTVCTW